MDKSPLLYTQKNENNENGCWASISCIKRRPRDRKTHSNDLNSARKIKAKKPDN